MWKQTTEKKKEPFGREDVRTGGGLRNRLLPLLLAVLTFAVFGFFYAGRREETQEPISATAFKLDTVVRITVYDSQDETILQDALALCDEYERIFSRTLPESELYRLNHQELPSEDGAYVLSDACAELIAQGLAYCSLTDGAFDISIAPLSSLWDFTSGEKTIPDDDTILRALELVDYRDVVLDGNRIRFEKEGMELELGAIAKGYIADQIKRFLVSKGVESAIIDLGGNVLCVGSHPDGEPFRVGVQRPFSSRNEMVASMEITDKSVVSSGVYERYFEKDGTLYHHILDPATGYPYDNGLWSVTIISDQSVDGDGLSTSCFALGLEKGMELVDRLPDVQAIFITEDGALHFSEGFEQQIAFTYTEE
ncbi:MAG: FAD:protein FMN transferase [Eubacteriales bacterium]|nr:FAD:protein FMN transferase [Eubacteriales bacterium]